jgi:hypothetical protein
MKYLLYFIWFMIAVVLSMPLMGILIITSLISWNLEYFMLVAKLWDDLWDLVFPY